jgi:hypothetical protein
MAAGEPPKHDPERVVALRRAALARAGYDAARADELARRPDVDLQHAVSLPRAGFPPEIAYQMLTAGARPVF